MTSVLIGGSRRLSRMNSQVSQRIENIIQKEMRVLIGDANGFDRAAQSYLAEHNYRAVLVYCTAGECRNNVGDWPKHSVEYAGRDRGLKFYTAKDDAMLRDADYGLFAWDGRSQGTLRNICKMAEQGKPSAVYVSPTKKFVTVRNSQDASALSLNKETAGNASQDLFSETWRVETVNAQAEVPQDGGLRRGPAGPDRGGRESMATQSDEQAIRDWIHTWLEASKAGDTGRCLSLLADDVVFMTVGRPPFGKKEFAGSPGQGKMKIEPVHDLREIRIAGDLAYTVSHLAVTVTPAGGEPMHLAGFILSVFRKQPDGNWLLSRDANLLVPQAPQQ